MRSPGRVLKVPRIPEWLHPRLALTLRRLWGTLAHCPPQSSGVLRPSVGPSDQLGSGATVGVCPGLGSPPPRGYER